VKLIRYNDLVARGVVASRMTLWRLIREYNFPEGKLITPNARAWDEAEVDAWIASRASCFWVYAYPAFLRYAAHSAGGY
jgi:predicted DNA-binding transcriptional regulator AlpA